MRTLLFCLVALCFSIDAYALAPPDPVPVYLTDGAFLLTDNEVYFITVCLAVLGAGWITFKD